MVDLIMKRVVVTGMGIVSCLGNDKQAVLESLRNGKSGIQFKDEYKEIGMRSHVAGSVQINLDDFIGYCEKLLKKSKTLIYHIDKELAER